MLRDPSMAMQLNQSMVAMLLKDSHTVFTSRKLSQLPLLLSNYKPSEVAMVTDSIWQSGA